MVGPLTERARTCTGLGVGVLASHVVQEVVDVGEVVVRVRGIRDEEVISRAERSPKTLSPFSRTGLKGCGSGGLLSRPAVHAASRDEEERNSSAVLRNLCREEEEILVRLSERSDLPFIGAREGGERLRRELKGMRETKRTNSRRRGAPFEFSVQAQTKCFSFRVTFRIPVVRGKNLDIGSAHYRNPQRVVTRRGEARHGVARRAAEEERAWMSLLFSCLYKWERSLPYKEVQLPLN